MPAKPKAVRQSGPPVQPGQDQIAARRGVASLLGLSVAAGGGLAILGWKLEWPLVKIVLTVILSMKVITALGILLCRASLAIQFREWVAAPYDIGVIVASVLAAKCKSIRLEIAANYCNFLKTNYIKEPHTDRFYGG